MDAISTILELFCSLSFSEQNEVTKQLQIINENQELANAKISECPHCKSSSFVKNGSVKGNTRYKCKCCKRSFGEFSETVLGGIIKKDKFLLFKKIMMEDGLLPLKKMCEKVGVSIQTAFDWRHKLLISCTGCDYSFVQQTQMDDIWVNYSQKGRRKLKYSRKRGNMKKRGENNFVVKVLMLTDKAQTALKVARIGRLQKDDIERTVGKYITPETMLVSDAHPSIVGFAKDHGLNHVSFKATDHVAETGENVQSLNAQALDFKNEINRKLRGVSTKYLQNYAQWFGFVKTHKNENLGKLTNSLLLENKQGWRLFSNIEINYKKFIEQFSERTYRCPVERSWKANNWNYM